MTDTTTQTVPMNLFQRINEVRRAVPYVQKDKDVSTGGGSYKAVTHDAVVALVRTAMIEHGIVCYPYLVESTSMPFEVWSGADGSVTRAKQFRYEATYDFTFINADDFTQSITLRIQGHAMDNADKAPGKALSYAKKYALLKLFEIETGENEEGRYHTFDEGKLDDNDIAVWVKAIQKTATKEEAKGVFQKALQDCKANGDLEAGATIKMALIAHGEALDKAAKNG